MKTHSAVREVGVAVVIPAYCAEAHIANVLRDMPDGVAWIVVVDDCSPDKTGAVVAEAARRDRRIRLLRHEVNQGVGGAVLTGYHEACRLGAEIIVKMDSDEQMDPRYLPALIDPIVRGQADYTKGNRFVHARQLRSMPLLRRVGNLGLSFLTKLASGYWNLFDPTNGYTAIHAAVVPMLNEETIGRRYFFESSMLLELSLLRAVARDVFIPARYGTETSHLSVIETLRQFPAALLRGFLRRLWIQYFVRDFSITSLYLVAGSGLSLAGTLFGAVHWYLSARHEVATPTGTVMLAVLPVVLGVQFLIQAMSLDIQGQAVQCLHRDYFVERDALRIAASPPHAAAFVGESDGTASWQDGRAA
jgi:glycosyltransferase involved in cell wall biosynthesis